MASDRDKPPVSVMEMLENKSDRARKLNGCLPRFLGFGTLLIVALLVLAYCAFGSSPAPA